MAHCKKCGKPATFVRTIRGMNWVHTETGNHIGTDPERHDVNTHIVKNPKGDNA